ncbi:hypothetical protein H0H93_003916 [Arthromyces matolae]|nr:hypothetical protein H0H93_003916 [Arthromyces matolae]
MLSVAAQRVNLANNLALKSGVSIIRDIIAKNHSLKSEGLTTDELYKLALQQPPPADFYNPFIEDGITHPRSPPPTKKGKPTIAPPGFTNPEHPVRSKAFLKNSVLSFLTGTQEIFKTRALREVKKNTLYRKTNSGKKVMLHPNDEELQKEEIWVWKPVNEENVLPEKKLSKIKPPNRDTLAFVNSPSQPRPVRAKREEPPEEEVVPTSPEPTRKHQSTPNVQSSPQKQPAIIPLGYELGLDEDLSHLSKKRASARRHEIREAIHRYKVLDGIRKQKERSQYGAELRRVQGEAAALKSAQEETRIKKVEQKWEERARSRNVKSPFES